MDKNPNAHIQKSFQLYQAELTGNNSNSNN